MANNTNIVTPPNPRYNTYYGARYVPIFAGAWDSTETYEPLVIVEYQGNSYTSKTFVPAGVEITNTEYWALTGNYNAQVEYYRQEVLNISKQLNTLETNVETNQENIANLQNVQKNTTLTGKNICFIGDSLTYGVTEGGAQSKNNYPKIFGVLTNSTITNLGKSQLTCTSIPNSLPHLEDLIETNDFSKYDKIFINIGINDLFICAPIQSTDRNKYLLNFEKIFSRYQLSNIRWKIFLMLICKNMMHL